MNETKTNGKMMIPNALVMDLAQASLNGTQLRLLLAISRYTFGFHRNSHEFSESFLANAIKVHPKQVQRELAELVRMGIVVVERDATFNAPKVLSINADPSRWGAAKKLPVNESVTHTGSESATSTGSESATQEIYLLKKIYKDNIVPFQEILNVYHSTCPKLPKVLKLTSQRKKHINARWNEMPDIEQWREYFQKVSACPFLNGANDRNWRCDFDWLINESNQSKVLEGKYDRLGRGCQEGPKMTDFTTYEDDQQ
jgi:phage replication O-like protein O